MLKKIPIIMTLSFMAFGGLTLCSPPAPADGHKHQDQIKCIADNIYWEARNQTVRGMIAVGLVSN